MREDKHASLDLATVGLSLTALVLGCSISAAAAWAQGKHDPAEEMRAARVRTHELEMQSDQQEHPTLKIGAHAPDFSLPGIDGNKHSLSDYRASPILAIVFISNHCPASQLYEERIKALVRDYEKKGVQVIAIAPNGPAAVGPSALNYTDVDDSFAAMKIRAEYRKFNFPYVYDGDTQSISKLYGPKVTPHIFIFDAQRILRYEGRIDDRMQPDKVKVRDARNALDAMLTHQPVAVDHTPVFGCSTKWNEHAASAQTEVTEWNAAEVTVEMASLEQLHALRSNPSGKTLMINFWATWCAPCQIEYPALLETYLWYRSRDFEFVSVSMNTPAEKAAVERFLKKSHSGVRNLLVQSDDVYATMAAFDPSWDSGLPFTIVISPEGKTLYRRQGEVDVLALRRTILGNLPDAGFSRATRSIGSRVYEASAMNRRSVIAQLTAIGTLGLAVRRAVYAAARTPRLGLQMFSLDAEMQRDPAGTLRDVAAMGYRDVELVGYYGLEPSALRAILDAASLNCGSIHIRPHGPSGRLPGLAADPQLHFRRCRELGVRYVVCPGPWFPRVVEDTLPRTHLALADIVAAVDRMRDQDWRHSADLVNQCAERAHANGLQLLYHNGNLEFARNHSMTGFDILLRHFDPQRVKVELDCGWIMAAGQNPLQYLRDNAGRIPLIHIKDMVATPANHRMLLNPAQIGQGLVDWRAQLEAARSAGVECAFIEQEAPFARPPLEYARNNLHFLQTLN